VVGVDRVPEDIGAQAGLAQLLRVMFAYWRAWVPSLGRDESEPGRIALVMELTVTTVRVAATRCRVYRTDAPLP
jgi:hypothetical protein